MTGETMNKYNAYWSAEHTSHIELIETNSRNGLGGLKRTVRPAAGITPSRRPSTDPSIIIDEYKVIEGLYVRSLGYDNRQAQFCQ